MTSEKQVGPCWGETKTEASWDGPHQEQPEVWHDLGEEADDILNGDSDFILVARKKKQGRQQDAGNAGRIPARRCP